MNNKKAQEMSMSIVIIAALAVIVLLLVGSFMTGGFKALTGKITGFVSAGPSAETSANVTSCDTACTTWKSSGCPASGGSYTDVINRCNAGTAYTAPVAVAGKTKYNIGACSCTTEGGSVWGN